jgi:CBS domain-containing protein
MNPREISGELVQASPRVRESDTIEHAVHCMLESGLPALPVTDEDDGLQGIFGEREFMAALFPGYVGQLGYAGFVPKTLDAAIERRATCRNEAVGEHLNRERVDVGADFSDLQLAETFLHHRVLIVPVVDGGRLIGIVTRADFFRRIAARVIGAPET